MKVRMFMRLVYKKAILTCPKRNISSFPKVPIIPRMNRGRQVRTQTGWKKRRGKPICQAFGIIAYFVCMFVRPDRLLKGNFCTSNCIRQYGWWLVLKTLNI